MIDSYNLTTVLDIHRMSGGKEQSVFTVPIMDSKKTTKQQQKCIIPTSRGNRDVTVKTLLYNTYEPRHVISNNVAF